MGAQPSATGVAASGGSPFPRRVDRARARRAAVLLAALLAAGLATGFHLAFGDMHLNLVDEGYLWYGVVAVLEGEVPFRDFQSYDPGRYVWCALLAPLFGSGIVGVRAAAAAFLAVGLFLGLLAARRLGRSPLWLLAAAPPLFLWAFPRHKVFEPALALTLVWALVRLAERPTVRTHLACGGVVGLAAGFGRNHGHYGALAAFLAAAWLQLRLRPPAPWRRFGALLAGMLLGYAPQWVAFLLVPGFAAGFAEAIADLAHKGANLPSPWPWPWKLEFRSEGLEALAERAVVASYYLPFVVLPLALLRLVLTPAETLRERALLLAASSVGLFYLHHVVVRSDSAHLAQAIHPVLLAALALPRRAWMRAATAIGLAAVSLFVAWEVHGTLTWTSPWKPPYTLVEREVAGERLRLLPRPAAYLDNLARSIGARMHPSDQIAILPARPTLYPVLGRLAPVRDIYVFWHAEPGEERELIRQLEERGVEWVLLFDEGVDRRPDRRYHQTHAAVWRHLMSRYSRVPTPLLPANHILLRRL